MDALMLSCRQAVHITRFGGPEVMDVVDRPDPLPRDGEQLYEVVNSAVLGDREVGSAFEAWVASSGHRVMYGTRIPPSSTARGSEFGWSVMAPGRPARRARAAISRELGHRGPPPGAPPRAPER